MAELHRLAEVKLPSRFWGTKKIRREKFQKDPEFQGLARGECWCCRENQAEHRHHLIQIQYGGLNTVHNIVALCAGCHAEVHPWMVEETGMEEFDAMAIGGAFS